MIRRNPTLIPMTDADVQEIRDLVARRKAEATEGMVKEEDTTTAAQQPSAAAYVAAEEARKKRLAMTKNERLGIES
ncbi:hypothetical protein EVG20_g8269 [Dentipellis fragilis]|uniref:Uncharacterized protein n=1 Tax=Dentipellis fragilis TaxID=205917 RepID=A0A4Y9Y8M8_9AGAM|nr:hypothetical protein EVG20_g8269 [Dentipellis fragilis]